MQVSWIRNTKLTPQCPLETWTLHKCYDPWLRKRIYPTGFLNPRRSIYLLWAIIWKRYSNMLLFAVGYRHDRGSTMGWSFPSQRGNAHVPLSTLTTFIHMLVICRENPSLYLHPGPTFIGWGSKQNHMTMTPFPFFMLHVKFFTQASLCCQCQSNGMVPDAQTGKSVL